MTLTGREVDELLGVPFSFEQRPRPTPGDGRPVWRIPYVLLLVRACRQQRARLEQLHVLNWALRTAKGADALESLVTGDISIEKAIVRYEPALDRAIALATGLDLLRFEANSWHLTDAAAAVLNAVDVDEELFAREKLLLGSLSKPLAQSAIARLLKRGASRA